MAAPWIVGLASGAGALGGLVVGGFAGTKLAGSTQTPDQQTAAVALGAATGMFLGAFALGALVAEPGPGGPAAAGTAGIPKGLGAAPVRRFAAINSQLAPAPARGLGWCITPGDPWHCDRAGNPLPTPHGGDPHPSLDNPKPYQPPGGGVGASSGSDVECYPVEGDDNRIVCAPVPAPPGNDVRFSVAQHRR